MYDTNTHHTEHFAKSEFNKQGEPGHIASMNLHRLCNDILEPARAHTEDGKVHVSEEGGYRPTWLQQRIWDNASPEERASGNIAHPGSSQHELGNAADCLMSRSAIPKFVEYLKTNPAVGGIGIYSWGVHVDRRPRNGGPIARWGMAEWW